MAEDLNQNNSYNTSYIQKDPIQVTNITPYDDSIETLAKIRLNLLKECLEMTGVDFGRTNNKIEYRNYLINNPPIALGGFGGGDEYTFGDLNIPPASGTQLSRAITVARILMSKGGFAKHQAAAIVGVFIDENGCDPTSYMKAEKRGEGAKGTGGFGYGAGIGSWTGTEFKNSLLKAAGYAPFTPIETLSLEAQANMLVIDCLGRMKKYYDAVKRCTTIEDASATACIITGGVGYSKNWATHPTPEDAMRMSNIYGASNDARFGKSANHWNLYPRRLAYAKQVYSNL